MEKQTTNLQQQEFAPNVQTDKFIFGIDASWFCKSRIAVLGKNGDIDLSFTDESKKSKTRAAIMSKFTMDLCAELGKMQHFVCGVVFAQDDSKKNLWRSKHEYLQPPFDIGDFTKDEDAGYKGTRQYDTVINWLEVYKYFWDWLDCMWKYWNVPSIKIATAEADDVLSMLSRWSLNNGYNFTWWGTDKDLIQLCDYKQRKNGTVAVSVYNMVKNGNKSNGWAKTRQLTCTADTFAIVQQKTTSVGNKPLSIFDSYNGAQQKPATNSFEAFINYSDKVQIEHVPSFLFYKIVLGDAGDNVPELFKYLKRRGSGMAHVSVNQIYDTLSSMGIETDNSKLCMPGYRYMLYDDLYDNELIRIFISGCYQRFIGTTINDEMLQWLVSRFEENRRLVVLNNKELPHSIQDEFAYRMSFYDMQAFIDTDIAKLKDFRTVIQSFGTALNLNAALSVNQAQGGADAQFAETFANNLFGNAKQ